MLLIISCRPATAPGARDVQIGEGVVYLIEMEDETCEESGERELSRACPCLKPTCINLHDDVIGIDKVR